MSSSVLTYCNAAPAIPIASCLFIFRESLSPLVKGSLTVLIYILGIVKKVFAFKDRFEYSIRKTSLALGCIVISTLALCPSSNVQLMSKRIGLSLSDSVAGSFCRMITSVTFLSKTAPKSPVSAFRELLLSAVNNYYVNKCIIILLRKIFFNRA